MSIATRLMLSTYGIILLGMLAWAGRGNAIGPTEPFFVKPDIQYGITVSCNFDGDAAVKLGDWVEGTPSGLCHVVPAQTIRSLGQVNWYSNESSRQGSFSTRRPVVVGDVER